MNKKGLLTIHGDECQQPENKVKVLDNVITKTLKLCN